MKTDKKEDSVQPEFVQPVLMVDEGKTENEINGNDQSQKNDEKV